MDQDITTVPQLINVLGLRGALQDKLEIWDTAGTQWKIAAIYTSEDDEDTICIDVERVENE